MPLSDAGIRGGVSDRTDQFADESLIAAASAAIRLASAMLGGRRDGRRWPVGYYPPGSR